MQLFGTVHEIGDLVPYTNGKGSLRTVIIETDGLFNTKALVPVTAFSDDATYLDPKRDVGRKVSCILRLQSSSYVGRDGSRRWRVSLSIRDMKLDQLNADKKYVDGPPRHTPAFPDNDDDIPF